jgi:hypothetical protein
VAEAGRTRRAAPADDADESGWRSAYLSWRRGRLARVQASARVWLSVLTTLLGLLGSVVLFKGGGLVTGITRNGYFQFFLIFLVGLVFVSAVLALIAGGAATWGGLGDIAPPATPEVIAPAAAAEVPAATASSQTADARPAVRTPMRRRWFAFWLLFSGESKEERSKLRALPTQRELVGLEPWVQYRDGSLNSADRRRAYLHASRNLGVVTAILIAVLAVLAVIAGTVAPAPVDVLVIHNGRTACVPAHVSTKFTHVSQVIPVNGC